VALRLSSGQARLLVGGLRGRGGTEGDTLLIANFRLPIADWGTGGGARGRFVERECYIMLHNATLFGIF
jgi:hypothetical protein